MFALVVATYAASHMTLLVVATYAVALLAGGNKHGWCLRQSWI